MRYHKLDDGAVLEDSKVVRSGGWQMKRGVDCAENQAWAGSAE